MQFLTRGIHVQSPIQAHTRNRQINMRKTYISLKVAPFEA